jgi:hypothetical protein
VRSVEQRPDPVAVRDLCADDRAQEELPDLADDLLNPGTSHAVVHHHQIRLLGDDPTDGLRTDAGVPERADAARRAPQPARP